MPNLLNALRTVRRALGALIASIMKWGVCCTFLELLLPLAISFFTFQQIAYLVDSYRNETKEYNFLDYSLFVTFFPQLISLLFFEVSRDGGQLVKNVCGFAHGSFVYLKVFRFGQFLKFHPSLFSLSA